ncbi:MAG: hypothetical protein AAGA56_11685 [Myxococcota bacterium]
MLDYLQTSPETDEPTAMSRAQSAFDRRLDNRLPPAVTPAFFFSVGGWAGPGYGEADDGLERSWGVGSDERSLFADAQLRIGRILHPGPTSEDGR